MLIGIDGNEANVPNRVGSNLYAFKILEALNQSVSSNRFQIYLKKPPLPDLPTAHERFKYRVIKPGKLWTQWRLPLDLYTKFPRPSILYTPGHYAPRLSPVKTVVTILDLAFIKYPNLFLKYKRGVKQLQSWTQYSVKQAAFVFVISRHTLQDAVKMYHLSQDKLAVAYPGIDEAIFQPSAPDMVKACRKKYQLTKPYILHVGTLQPRKNLDRLLQAFESLPPKAKSLNLVLVGGQGWLMEEFEKKLKSSPKANLIRQLGYVDLRDLPALYSGSVCTAAVGLEEGFGLPPAEALACGACVVASKTGALPEVVGEAGIMVDPYSVTSIRHGLLTAIIQTESVRKSRQNLGFLHVSQFNWTKTAKIIEDKLYELAVS